MIYTDSLARGLKIVPIPPRSKACKLKDWPRLAVNSAEIMQGCPADSNYGCVADGTFCILDVDDLESFHREITVRLPQTYTVATSRGAHYYMQHTVASRRLGNRAAGIFDFQAVDKYVVGAGSTHPSGRVYEVVDPSAIAEIPNALTMALGMFVKVRKRERARGGLKYEDREDMLKFCGRIVDGVRSEGDVLEMLIEHNGDLETPLSIGDLQRMATWAVERWEPNRTGPTIVRAVRTVKSVRRY